MSSERQRMVTTGDLGALTTDSEPERRSQRRRQVIEYLEESPGSATVQEVADYIADRTLERTDVAPDERRRLCIELHHNHLPRLDAHDLVDYDRDAGIVTRR